MSSFEEYTENLYYMGAHLRTGLDRTWSGTNYVFIPIFTLVFILRIFKSNSLKYNDETKFEWLYRLCDDCTRYFTIIIFQSYFFLDSIVIISQLLPKYSCICRLAYLLHHIITICMVIPFSTDFNLPYSNSLTACHLFHAVMSVYPSYSKMIGVPYFMFMIKSVYDGLWGYGSKNYLYRKSSLGGMMLCSLVLFIGFNGCMGNKDHIEYLTKIGEIW